MKKLLLILLCLPLLFTSCEKDCKICELEAEYLNGISQHSLDSICFLFGYNDFDTYFIEREKDLFDWEDDCWDKEDISMTEDIILSVDDDIDSNGVDEVTYNLNCY